MLADIHGKLRIRRNLPMTVTGKQHCKRRLGHRRSPFQEPVDALILFIFFRFIGTAPSEGCLDGDGIFTSPGIEFDFNAFKKVEIVRIKMHSRTELAALLRRWTTLNGHYQCQLAALRWKAKGMLTKRYWKKPSCLMYLQQLLASQTVAYIGRW